jgi:hypothetical protein
MWGGGTAAVGNAPKTAAARGSGVVAASPATRRVGKAHRAQTKKKQTGAGKREGGPGAAGDSVGGAATADSGMAPTRRVRIVGRYRAADERGLASSGSRWAERDARYVG